MERTKPSWVFMFGLGWLLVSTPASLQASSIVLDDFNRPDSSSLGSNWTVQSGGFSIHNGRATNNIPGSIATYNGVTATSVTLDVFATGCGLDYAAVVLGYADTDNNVFVKVQKDWDSSEFSKVGFYYGNNGTNNPAWSNWFYGDLPSSFSEARITISLVGDDVVLEADTNFDGIAEHAMTRNDVPLGMLGNGVGIGGFSDSASLDNFTVNQQSIISPRPGQTLPEGQQTGGIHAPEPIGMVVFGIAISCGLYGLYRRKQELAGLTAM